MPAVVAEPRGASDPAADPVVQAAQRARRDWWVAAVRREGAGFAAAADAADLDTEVPSCPGWTVRRLVSHLARVHRSGMHGVLDGTVEPPALTARPPDDARLLDWYRNGLDRLLDTLVEAEPHLPDFWPRRLAHETTIHRFDAELAAYERAGDFDPPLAADGVGEVVESMLPPRAAEEPLASVRGDVLVDCTDTGDSWLVRLEPGRIHTERQPVPRRADARIAGPAADLYLVLWGRLPLDPFEPGRTRRGRVEVSGDRALAALIRAG
jgi:uncharacterized protein (TIGR03083 family)